MNVGWIENGDWIKAKGVAFGTGAASFTPATTVQAGGWTLLSGTATVSWTGTLSRANFYVETAPGSDSLTSTTHHSGRCG